jgi:hypothetical protein
MGQDGCMADRYRTADGWSVEVVRLTCTPDRHDGEWLRLRYLGYHIHNARSVMELESYIRLSELEDSSRRPGLSLGDLPDHALLVLPPCAPTIRPSHYRVVADQELRGRYVAGVPQPEIHRCQRVHAGCSSLPEPSLS